MTCRRDSLLFSLTLLAGVWGLAACDSEVGELPPLERARMDLATGRAADAQVILKRLLEEGTDRTEIAAYLGQAALARGDLAEAGDWLATGEFSEQTRAHGFRMQGRLAMAEGKLAEAGGAFDRSLALDPNAPELWVDVGRFRYQGGEQLQALEAAERAVELGPQNPAALQFRGQLARDSKGMEAGVQWFERALERQPDNIDLRVDLAATLGDAGRAREALAVLRGGTGSAAATPRALFVQAVIAARAGNLSVARDLLDRSEQQRDGVPAAVLLSAIIDIEEENFGAAAQTLDRLLREQPDNARVIDLLAMSLSRSGGENELVRRFGKRAASASGSAYLRTLVGRALEALGDRTSAAAYLDQAAHSRRGLVVLPGGGSVDVPAIAGTSDARDTRDRIRADIQAGRPTVAVARARELARRFPGSTDVLALLGDAELANGNRRAASRAYSRSATIRQPWPLVPRMTASLFSRDTAVDYLRDFVIGNPANGDAAAMLADAYAQRGDWERAAILLDHAMSVGHDRVPWVLAARSTAARQMGDTESALAFALAASELQPTNRYAVAALISALPEGEDDARAELELKLRSLLRN
ncbi:MAG: tetratricopeptide repeat protein [Erythrobacter sp.]